MIPITVSSFGNKYVTNIQQGSITVSSGALSATATITSVDTSKSWIIYLGQVTNLNADQNDHVTCKLTFTNSTTITANRGFKDGATTNVVNFVVITAEQHLVESIQTGSIAITALISGTATITSVDTTRSAVFYLGETGTDSGTIIARSHSVTLTDATTVTATANSSTTGSVGYVVVQFRANIIKSLQQFNNSFSTANTTDNQTISSVSMANTMLAWGNVTSGGTGTYTIQLTSATNVALVRVATSVTIRTPCYTVIEFKPGVLRSIQRGIQSLSTNVTGVFAFIGECSNNKSFCNLIGVKMTSTAPARSRFMNISKSAESPDTGEGFQPPSLSCTRNSSDSSVAGVGYEIIEFM